jgi:DNA-binding XRE family transcriptional regulator
MDNLTLGNYLRAHRRKSGLSQRELGLLLGYVNEGQVNRHERSKTIPPLIAALSYEIVFRVAVSEIFNGLYSQVERMMEENLAAFEAKLQEQNTKGRKAAETAQKLVWLMQRRDL